MASLAEELVARLRELAPQSAPSLSPATEITSLGLESVQIMEFIMDVEDAHDIAIDLEQLGRIRTIAELAAVVAALKQGND